MHHRYGLGNLIIKFTIVLFIVIIVGGIIAAICIPLLTQDTVTATVTDKMIYTTTDCSDDSGCSSETHLTIYTDKEVLEIQDCIFFWEWGEQQKYGSIEKGKTYSFKVYGFNFAPFRMYRAAYRFEPV